MLSEISDRKILLVYDITYMWNLEKKNTNKCTCKTEADSQIQKTNYWLPNSRGKREGKLEYKTNRYKLSRIKQISNKDILYSTGDYSHYLNKF